MTYGRFQKRYKVTIKGFIKNSLARFLQGQWYSLGYYVVSETANILAQKQIFQRRKILTCPLCQFSASSFVHLSNHFGISWNAACPNCDSRSRHRGLVFLYGEYLQNSHSKKILHFAPETNLRNAIRKYRQHKYLTTDFKMLGVDYPHEDIQNLRFDNSTFDLILNNHVLEHVFDDRKAVSEISRILKPKGMAIITIPGNWRRGKTKIYNHLNYNGHYRDYAMDILDILQNYFLKVKKRNLFHYNGKAYAIKPLEIAFICFK